MPASLPTPHCTRQHPSTLTSIPRCITIQLISMITAGNDVTCANPGSHLCVGCITPCHTCVPNLSRLVFHTNNTTHSDLTCVPKSSFMTSSYCSTVLSPALGVQWAATQFKLQPVGKAMPAGAQQQIRQRHQQKAGRLSEEGGGLRGVSKSGWVQWPAVQFKLQPVGTAIPAAMTCPRQQEHATRVCRKAIKKGQVRWVFIM
jgi:hypothetical protein